MSIFDSKDASARVANLFQQCLSEIHEAPAERGGIAAKDTPPCRKCGGAMEIKFNARQNRWYAWCGRELRSWGHGATAVDALEAHKNLTL